MKPEAKYVAQLRQMLSEPAASLDSALLLNMIQYLELVMQANQSHNLTAVRSFEDGLQMHLADSLEALPEVLDAPRGTMCDLGSGGGFPGVPLAVAAQRDTLLLDSVAKKMRVVETAVVAAGLSGLITSRAARSEEVAAEAPGYAVVVARAVAELPVLVELASPLLAEGGRLIALKGDPTPDELDRGGRAGAECAMQELSVRPTVLSGGQKRTVVVYSRVAGQPARQLPRRPGIAGKRPLA